MVSRMHFYLRSQYSFTEKYRRQFPILLLVLDCNACRIQETMFGIDVSYSWDIYLSRNVEFQIHTIDVHRYSFRTSQTCSFHISQIPGNSREICIGIPAIPGNGLTGNRATLLLSHAPNAAISNGLFEMAKPKKAASY